jgi:hypothetical protein
VFLCAPVVYTCTKIRGRGVGGRKEKGEGRRKKEEGRRKKEEGRREVRTFHTTPTCLSR